MSVREASLRVPLLLRPANAPVPFVGRAAEEKRLVDALTRGPVAVVCGFSGVGKSGLVAHALATQFAEARERTLVVDGGDVTSVVAAALAAVTRLGASVEPSAPNPGHALLEMLEENALWLWLDDVERIDDELRALLHLVQRFANHARVICVCREDPRDPLLALHTVSVGPMSRDELRALLDDIEPGLADGEAAGIVANAKGSPWRVRQLSMGGVVDEQGPEKSLLMLAPIAMNLLRTLALVAVSVPPAVLARATRMPDDDALETLARRGYVDISARGVRLHASARPLVTALLDADDRGARAQKLVQAVVDAGNAELAASVLPLLRSCPVGLVRALYEQHGTSLREDGHARALLDAVDDARARDGSVRTALACAALEIAIDVGGDALSSMRARDVGDERGAGDERDAFATLVSSARALAARGEVAAASSVAEKVAANKRAPVIERLRAAAVIFRARDGDRSSADAASLTNVSRIPPEQLDVVERAWWATLRFAALRADDRATDPPHDVFALAQESVRELEPALFAAAPSAHRALAPILARALRIAGDPRAAERVLSRTSTSTSSFTAAARAAELERAHTALALADLDDARDRFARAASFPNALERIEAQLGLLATRIALGELRGFTDDLAAVLAAMQEHGAQPHLARSADALLDEMQALAGAGDARALPSLDDARKARARARDAGLALAALEASRVCIDAAIVAGDLASVAVEAEQLRSASARAGSRRYALDARFAALVVDKRSDGKLSSTVLVELARTSDENPRVARRASALLGETVALDDVDHAVLAALSAHAAKPAVAAVVKQTAKGPEWTVDAGSMSIILVDGSVVDLSTKKVLFDLLAALCERGGAASKEQLLERAWGVREYHPLHHDNRLKVAVRKLRRLLEEILGDDPIESAENGYRLRGKVRFLKA